MVYIPELPVGGKGKKGPFLEDYVTYVIEIMFMIENFFLVDVERSRAFTGFFTRCFLIKEGGLTLLVPMMSLIRSFPTTSFRPVLALSYKTKVIYNTP